MGAILISLRPKQWVKNLVVFAGLIFSRNAFNWSLQWKAWITFVTFCAVVGAGYMLNDVLDRGLDRNHPGKKNRPIACGRLGAGSALGAAAGLVVAAVGAGFTVDPLLPFFLCSYMALQLAYTLVLKHVVIVDVLLISAGFILRAVAGAAVIHVTISPWLIICAMLLALFLGLAKRRAELTLLRGEAAGHRRNLEHYSVEIVDQMTGVTASATLVSYASYSFTSFESHWMMLTIPFVLYGIFRYLYLVHIRLRGGSPEQVLLTDVPLLINIMLWGFTAEAVLELA